MLSLEEYWKKASGTTDVPPEIRDEWNARVAPRLESPSGAWEADLEAEAIVAMWLRRRIWAAVGKSCKQLDTLAKAREAESRIDDGKIDEALSGIRVLMEKMNSISPASPAPGPDQDYSEEFQALAEQNVQILSAIRELEEKPAAPIEMPVAEPEEKTGILERMRTDWKVWAACAGICLVLMASVGAVSWKVGWQAGRDATLIWYETDHTYKK